MTHPKKQTKSHAEWRMAGLPLTIVVPYRQAERLTPLWAESEDEILFRRQPRRACRCTLAFAAMELKRFLLRTIPDLRIQFASRPPRTGHALILEATDPVSRADAFALIPERQERLRIRGEGRTGVLFGAYAFLALQGWRWYAPGEAGEIAPGFTDRLTVPGNTLTEKSGLRAGRSFDLESYSQESRDLLMWAARNRFNVWAGRAGTLTLANKLGMILKAGGHIFEQMLHPHGILPDGRTLWEAHPDWFGLPADGVRRIEHAQHTQFCVSRPDLIEFLGRALERRLQTDWAYVDRLDVWGFDTWGQTCQCPSCQKLGNPSDAMLVLASRLRAYLDRAESDRRLDRHVTLILCAYEGTASLDGPSRSVPKNLAADGTLVSFYPINRCYRHALDDRTCETNRRYWKALQSWTGARPKLRIGMGEYYNVSKFEDLPLLFSEVMRRDWPAYADAGVCGATYMHIPAVQWGLRTLTQNLYARLSWNPARSTAEEVTAGYFRNWYGEHDTVMRRAYRLTETAWACSAQWRAWAGWSVLSQLLQWDGRPAATPLALHEHLGATAAAVVDGRRSIKSLRAALALVASAKRRERMAAARNAPVPGRAVNPAALRLLQTRSVIASHLAEDLRLLQYGLDVMELTVGLLAYHEALRLKQKRKAATVWAEIEFNAERLEQYVVPTRFEWPGPGLLAPDACVRSQLGPVVERCRAFRLQDSSSSGVHASA